MTVNKTKFDASEERKQLQWFWCHWGDEPEGAAGATLDLRTLGQTDDEIVKAFSESLTHPDNYHYFYNIVFSGVPPALKHRLKLAITQANFNFGSAKDFFTGIRNTLKNMPLIAKSPDVHDFIAEFNEAIVIMAGPSIDSQFDYLRKIQQGRLVVCADIMLKRCLAEGVYPHFVICAERGKETFELLGKLTKAEKRTVQAKGITLLASYVVQPKTIRAWPGRLGFYCRHSVETLFFNWPVKSLCSDPFVANASLACVEAMGVTIVYTAGLDLAYPASGASHAGLNNKNVTWTVQNDPHSFFTLSWSGEYCQTTDTWYFFARRLEDFLNDPIRTLKKVHFLAPHGQRVSSFLTLPLLKAEHLANIPVLPLPFVQVPFKLDKTRQEKIIQCLLNAQTSLLSDFDKKLILSLSPINLIAVTPLLRLYVRAKSMAWRENRPYRSCKELNNVIKRLLGLNKSIEAAIQQLNRDLREQC